MAKKKKSLSVVGHFGRQNCSHTKNNFGFRFLSDDLYTALRDRSPRTKICGKHQVLLAWKYSKLKQKEYQPKIAGACQNQLSLIKALIHIQSFKYITSDVKLFLIATNTYRSNHKCLDGVTKLSPPDTEQARAH